MSDIQNAQRYFNPGIPPKPKSELIYKNYSRIRDPTSSIRNSMTSSQVLLVDQQNIDDYPRNASYSRFPVTVYCQNCKQLGLSEIEYEHGNASKFWCFLLLPFLGTGACCLCLNSCKDVKHVCSSCRATVGLNKSSFW